MDWKIGAKEVTSIEEMRKILRMSKMDLKLSLSGQFVWEIIPQKLRCKISRAVKTDEYGRAFNPLIKYYSEEMLVKANLKWQPSCDQTCLYCCRLLEPEGANLPFVVELCGPKEATHVMLQDVCCCKNFYYGLLKETEYFVDTETGWLVVPLGYQAIVYDARIDKGFINDVYAERVYREQLEACAEDYRQEMQKHYENELAEWLAEAELCNNRATEREEFDKRLEQARGSLRGIDPDVLLEAFGKVKMDDLNDPVQWILQHGKPEERSFRWCGEYYYYSEAHVKYVEDVASDIISEAEELAGKVRAYEAKHGMAVEDVVQEMYNVAKHCRVMTRVVRSGWSADLSYVIGLQCAKVRLDNRYVEIVCPGWTRQYNYTLPGLVRFKEDLEGLYRTHSSWLCRLLNFITRN